MITRSELCQLIPHSFDMCLLDRVESWDENNIVCLSQSHQLANHPLQYNGKLSSIHLLEYAAQAMAVHGGLQRKQENREMIEGYLAALRDISINVCELSEIKDELRIEAKKIIAQEGNMIYSFAVSAEQTVIVSGRATIMSINKND